MMRKLLLSVILVLASVIIAVPAAAGGKMEGDGFDTPEEAVTAYIEGLGNNDIDAMLSPFAIETYVENYSIEKNVERMKAYIPSVKYLPNISEFASRINSEIRREEIMGFIRGQYLVLQNSNLIVGDNAGQMVMIGEGKDYESGSDFVAGYFASDDSAYISDLRFDGDFIDPAKVSDAYTSESNQKNLESLTEVMGADELRSTVSVFYRNEDAFALCMDCARYGDKWYLYTPQGNIAMLSGMPMEYCGLFPLEGQSLAELGID